MAEQHHMQNKTNAGSEIKVEKEDFPLLDEHSLTLNVKFKSLDHIEYTIYCSHTCTVLEALKSSKKYNAQNWTDEKMFIQLGKADKKNTVATHFPCSCIKDGESLIISHMKEQTEKSHRHNQAIIHPRSRYSVFFIDTVGGLNSKEKQFFRNNKIKKFKYLCVYGEKGTTVEDALKRDGRFIDDLGEFTLSHNENPNTHTEHTQYVDNLDEKKFKLCLPRSSQLEMPSVLEQSQQKTNTTADVAHQSGSSGKTDVAEQRGSSGKTDVAQQRGSSGKTALRKQVSANSEKIYQYLCQQFPGLKEWMESRSPNDSYLKNLKKENFGKIQNSFSKVNTLRYLIKLGESVCKIEIKSLSSTLCVDGTGFVLFDNFVLTNAHLFEPLYKQHGDNWQQHTEITATFNYENSGPESNQNSFKAEMCIHSDNYLDYAVLELMVQETETDNGEETKVPPPGLLKIFAPLPDGGGACIIGHPAGDVKKMDVTCVIVKERREEAVNELLKARWFVMTKIYQELKDQHIDNILKGGNKADIVATYNTFMYNGSSGSPVFDAQGQVFGLHSAGLICQEGKEHVIEFAGSLLTIFENFVRRLEEIGNKVLLNRVKEETIGNSHLQKVFRAESDNSEPMDESGDSEAPQSSV